MAEPDNIVLEHLRHVRGAIDDVRDDIREMKQRARQSRKSVRQHVEPP